MRPLVKHFYELVGVGLLGLVASSLGFAQNPIQTENSQQGTSGWQLANPAINREIEGYASLTSVNIGGNIDFFVSTTDSSFRIEVFRTGWYGGVGARRLLTVNNVAGRRQATPAPDPVTGMVECRWIRSHTLAVPGTWVSGIFLARLTGNQSGKQSYIIFTVRDDGRASDVLFQSSVTTYQAYNFWPNGANGKSLYNWAPGGRAWKVSFNRPYVLGASYTPSTPGTAAGLGAGEYLTNIQPGPAVGYPIPPAGFEYNMVRWLERNGYDVTYLTNIDLHQNPALLSNHRAFLSVGHDEYWSMSMRQNLQNALNNGLNVGFFASNAMYWQVRFESGVGGADRTMVCYKYDAQAHDPNYNSNPSQSTVTWRSPPVNRPEAGLIGVEYVGDPVQADIVISNASHWLMNGTGLNNGDRLPGLLGYEMDVMVPGTSPSNITVLASSPGGPFGWPDNPPGFSCHTQACNSNVTWYSAGRSFVFATGSLQWSWGLDDYNAPTLRPTLSNPAAQKITANVLGAFLTPVSISTTSLPSGTVGAPYGPFQLTASGGGPPYTWTASGLPPGISLSASGTLSGTPTAAGTSSVSFVATDAAMHTGAKTLSLVISGGAATYTISGRVTSGGTGFSGATISLSTGSTTTTDSAGNYAFGGLPSGTYTVTPSRSGYSFTPPNRTFTNITGNQSADFVASQSSAAARAISIHFVGSGTAMGASESAGVVPKANWNNAFNNVSSGGLPLVDETGAGNGATVTWGSDNNWAVPIGDSAGNFRMMRGYIDNGNQNPSTVNVSGLPASSTGYDVYVYTDGDNEGATVTGTYRISGSGITTTNITATDPGNNNFNGTFQQAVNSPGNYVRFTSIRATAFTISAIPTTASDNVLRAPVNGIQIIPSPQVQTTARVVSINFVGSATAMAASESAGVVPKANWNNAFNNASSTALSLVDETGSANGANVTWSSDNTWAVPITDSAGNFRMMQGYLDNGGQNPITVNVSNLPPSGTGYDIYIYIDGDNAGITRTGTYRISGSGITTTNTTATDPGNSNFNGTFQQAVNSTGNYVKFTSIQATSVTITAIPTTASNNVLRAPVNGIQIVPSPQAQPARAVSINFVGSGSGMAASESAGVVPKANWNNASNNVSSAPLSLLDDTGAANGANVTWTSDNNWSVPITDSAGNFRMIRGYIDNGNQNPSTVNVSGLPASSTGYDVYVYTDGDNEGATVTGTYRISGSGITTTSITATDPGNSNFNGTFHQAVNSPGNYVRFTSIQATAFTISAIPTTASDNVLRAPVNGIQVVPR